MTGRAAVLLGQDGVSRCSWAGEDPEYQRYHDEEWGRPLHGDRPLYEKLTLEGFQAGLSWITILRRRPTFRTAFHDFDFERIAEYDEADVERLMADPGIIRNRAKVLAAISNARVTRELVRSEPGALDRLLWGFAPAARGRVLTSWSEVPAETPESKTASRELKRLGYRFVGPTTVYALMQSSGMVDDHLAGCWRAEA
ncbi:DNA-3-methyladenine glycosylase I [Homoserinibacter sp. YIM 151385]|uniref:DNA-3-methyladenine glycosylase I n=1 Tax=Homoserinibacter sp. YIM 151385 TaxID=2985506 RepID=UPI0022F0476A|nr:DNA-3-methyladenine glycosylase I [Homoserinibacter sp. YIM 151385]WBU38297.1 DNA-3-methyladenine glycosylase I [Homoserinibacter sp. YIM 151385]